MANVDTYAGYTIAALVATGGAIGFIKAGSTPSLIAGGGSGVLLAYGVLRATRDPKDVSVVMGATLFLMGVMGKKFLKSGKFMPAGLITPSPFTCFSPTSGRGGGGGGGYIETLPRSSSSPTPKRTALSQLNSSYTPSSPNHNTSPVNRYSLPAEERRTGKSFESERNTAAEKGGLKAMMKRRSAGPFVGSGGGMLHKRVISKDMIGLPTNFVHEGHVGVDQVRNRGEELDLQATLDEISQALADSPPRTRQPQARPAASLPHLSTKNSLPLPPPPPIHRVGRKAPPPVTASVIKQAGRKAVLDSGGGIPASPPLPSLPTSAGFHDPLESDTFQFLDAKPHSQSPVIITPLRPSKNAESSAVLRITPSSNDFAIAPKLEVGEASGRSGYMTESLKKRWNNDMKEIEDALKF